MVEFTTDGQRWHVHLHVAVYAGFIPFAELRALWRKVGGGSYIRLGTVPTGGVGGYLTKYLTLEKVAADLQKTASDAFVNRRLYNTFGFAFNVKNHIVKKLYACPRCHLVDTYVPWRALDWISKGYIRLYQYSDVAPPNFATP